jgi:hypothetical protein
MTVEDLPLDWHDEWEERAAIMEYCGGCDRREAESLALADILQRMRREEGDGEAGSAGRGQDSF